MELLLEHILVGRLMRDAVRSEEPPRALIQPFTTT